MNAFSRRNFLTKSSLSAAGVATGATFLAARSRAQALAANEKVVLALVGAGGRGSAHAAGFAQVANTEFKYICAVDERRGTGLLQDLAKGQDRAPKRLSEMRIAFDDKDVNGV